MEQPKNPQPVDIATGHNVRVVRRLRGISQEALAEKCDVTFQQIQKYENGSNRISISRLYQIAAALGVHPGSLLPDMAEVALSDQASNDPASEWLMGREAFDLAVALQGVSKTVRSTMVAGVARAARAVAEAIGDRDPPAAPAAAEARPLQ